MMMTKKEHCVAMRVGLLEHDMRSMLCSSHCSTYEVGNIPAVPVTTVSLVTTAPVTTFTATFSIAVH